MSRAEQYRRYVLPGQLARARRRYHDLLQLAAKDKRADQLLTEEEKNGLR